MPRKPKLSVTKTELRFPCGDLSLEGVLHMPEGEGPFAAVVVCHPHPTYGGSMENNVVLAVSEALAQRSIVAFRFNFRGVEGSDGKPDRGIAEREDVSAAISLLSGMERVNPKKIGLCGYSFGGGVALAVTANDQRVQAVAAISVPLPLAASIRKCAKPKLLLSGSRDQLIAVRELQRFSRELPGFTDCDVLPGPDHFWAGYEDEAAYSVASFFDFVLNALLEQKPEQT